jgi:DNA-binding CsgD family transcriptional regulator
MDRQQSILQAIRGVYDAALDAERWSDAFAAIGRAAAGAHVIFFVEDLPAGRVRFATGIGVGPDFFRRLAAAGEARILPPQLHAIPTGNVRATSSLWTNRHFDLSPFYNEVVRPDGGYAGLVAVPFRDTRHSALLAVERLRGARDYEPADAAALQAVLPHLANALQVRLRLDGAESTERWACAALDLLDFGLIIADAEARPIFVNRCAEKMIHDADALSIHRGRLHAGNSESTRALHRALKHAADIGDTRPRNQAEAEVASRAAVRLSLSNPSRESVLLAAVMPLGPANSDRMMMPRACAMLFLTRPNMPPRLDADALAMVFGLTPRQSELAVLLASGVSLARAAAGLGISLETGRWHLKEIFERTEVHRQIDLVRLVLQTFETPLNLE